MIPPASPQAPVIVVGAALLELRFYVDSLPRSGGDVLARTFDARVGGSAVNVAGTLRALGGSPLLVLHRGSGPFDRLVDHELRRLGLSVGGGRSRWQSGITVTLVEESGERSLVSALGAEGFVGRRDLQRVDLAAARFLYVSGYELLASKDLAKAVSSIPRGLCVVMDPGPRASAPDAAQDAWRRADWVRLNAREARRRTGIKDPRLAAAALAQDRRVAVTTATRAYLGREGTAEAVPSGRRLRRDTTGAGDAHCAGLIAALARGMGDAEAIGAANRVARAHVAGDEIGPWLLTGEISAGT